MIARCGYDGVVVGVPVSIPYQRFSIQGAEWWLGRVLREALRGAAHAVKVGDTVTSDLVRQQRASFSRIAAVAAAIVRALRDGQENVAISDGAQDLLARWADNQAILVREPVGWPKRKEYP